MTSIPTIVYSVGPSDHELDAIIALLRRYSIAILADVRSQPYSRWVSQFNRETLARALQAAGLTYVFMGDSLGGRPSDPSLYDSGQSAGRPDYERIAATPASQARGERLLELARTSPVAKMCGEGD